MALQLSRPPVSDDKLVGIFDELKKSVTSHDPKERWHMVDDINHEFKLRPYPELA